MARKSRDKALKKGSGPVSVCGVQVVVLPSKFPCLLPSIATDTAPSHYGPSSDANATTSSDGAVVMEGATAAPVRDAPLVKGPGLMKPRTMKKAVLVPRTVKENAADAVLIPAPDATATATADAAPPKSNADFRKFL